MRIRYKLQSSIHLSRHCYKPTRTSIPIASYGCLAVASRILSIARPQLHTPTTVDRVQPHLCLHCVPHFMQVATVVRSP